MSGCVEMHQITDALKGFTLNFCLSHEKLKEKSVNSYKPVCTVFYFSYGGKFTASGQGCSCHTQLVSSGGKVVAPPFSSRLVFSFLVLGLLIALSRLVQIILCPLHDCYKLRIQRRRC